jgi:hypothetical protein
MVAVLVELSTTTDIADGASDTPVVLFTIWISDALRDATESKCRTTSLAVLLYIHDEEVTAVSMTRDSSGSLKCGT